MGLFVPFKTALLRAEGGILLPIEQHGKSIANKSPVFECLPNGEDSTKSTLLAYRNQFKSLIDQPGTLLYVSIFSR